LYIGDAEPLLILRLDAVPLPVDLVFRKLNFDIIIFVYTYTFDIFYQDRVPPTRYANRLNSKLYNYNISTQFNGYHELE